MIVLAIVACLDTAPDTCREFNMTFANDISPRTCVTRVQPILAQWNVAHPSWRVARWRCTYADETSRQI